MSTTKTLTESQVLEDDNTMHSAIGAEARSELLLSPKRKLAETGDGTAEKRYRSDETEEQKPLQGGGARDDEDSSDDELGHWGNMLDDPEIAKIWAKPDPIMCCSNDFTDLEFKHDTQLYNDLKAFCVNAVDYLNGRYKEAARFHDIEEVRSCHAPCAHCIVTLKSKDASGQAWEIVLRGVLPPQGFAEAKPHEFYMLEHCRV